MKLLVLINFLPLLISWANAVMPEESETRTGHLRATREQLPGGGLDPNPDRWIVELRPNATVANTALKLARYNGGRVGYSYNSRAFNGFTITTNNIEDIANNPNVLSVTRDSVAKATGQIIPSGIIRTHASSKNYMKTASDSCLCDAVVAVFDTGVDFDHPDLNVNSAMSVDCTIGNATHRCVQGSGEDDRKGGDDNGHGTHVAGVVAAINNDEGVVGVCPGAEIWSIKVLNSDGVGYWSSILGGLDWATNNADKIDVINLSLGNAGCYVPLCNAIAKAKDAGIAIAVAAGNDNGLASDFMPACCEGVMVVSAMADTDGLPGRKGTPCRRTRDDKVAAFSNYGESVDMVAPGVCVTSTYMNGEYATLSGTSMAAPHVAGALAVLASNNHNGNVDEMYETLTSNGNYRYTDKLIDPIKEPLLDMRNIPDANMVGSCTAA